MPKFKIKRDDVVIVTAGKHKGRTGKVLKVLPEKSRVVVEKVNLVKRHVRPQGDRPGGTVEKEASLHISNVALLDQESGKAVKVGRKFLDDGRKVRFNRKTGAVID
jgi:large subunit ribosomal protein L24